MRKIFLFTSLALGGLYLFLVLGYVVFQRQILYHPALFDGSSPAKYQTPYQTITIQTPDQVQLSGWWLQHPGSHINRPALIYCHGNSASLSMLDNITRIFYNLYGFDTLVFDYRGYGNSQKAPLSEEALATDALAAYHWLQSRGYRENQIIIWGHSLGSSVAARLAAHTHPAGLVLEGAFPSVYAMAQYRYPWMPLFHWMIFDPFNTQSYVTQRTCPLLQLHAEKDSVIPPAMGRRVFEAASEPKQWILLNDVDHSEFCAVSDYYQERILSFVRACLRGTSSLSHSL